MNGLKFFETPADSLEFESSIYAWGATLTKNCPETSWHPFEDDDAKLERVENYLTIKQAVLGSSAVDGERNVVQFQTFDIKNQPLTMPFISMLRNQNEMCSLDLKFEPCGNQAVKFKLIEGKGPVHLIGEHHIEALEDESDSESYAPISKKSVSKNNQISPNDKMSKKKETAKPKTKPATDTLKSEPKEMDIKTRTRKEKKVSVEVDELINGLSIDQKKNTRAAENEKKAASVFNSEGYKTEAVIKRKKAAE